MYVCVCIYTWTGGRCLCTYHIQLATTQGLVLRNKCLQLLSVRESQLSDGWSHPHSKKDLIFLQAQLVVLVSLFSLAHSQQSCAFQKHTMSDWVSVKRRKN